MNTLPVKTTKEVALLNGKSLAVVRRENNENEAVKIIISLIQELNDALNIQRKMNMEQMIMAAELIIEEYYYLRIHELIFVFKNAIKGRYGQMYESIDVTKIFFWLNQYAEQREAIYWEKSIREHLTTKQNEKC